MSENCNCSEWRNLVELHDFIVWEPPYGWLMKWIEVTKEKGYSQIHRYGIPIEFCPKCGKKLKSK